MRDGPGGDKTGSVLRGDVLGGRYHLLGHRPLGRGGCGEVWRARDARTGEVVAAKIAVEFSRETCDRLGEEYRVTRDLRHPNIPAALDVEASPTSSGRGLPCVYLIRTLVVGSPIRRYCELNKLGNGERLRLIAAAAAAIDACHNRGLVHRDLKPANLLVDANGVVHIIDFGIAIDLVASRTVRNIRTVTDVRLGTYDYTPPEADDQQRGNSAARAWDIYSLGAVMYELLTGTVPRRATRRWRGEEFHPTLSDAAEAAGRGYVWFSEDLEAIALYATHEEVGVRYRTAAEFASEVERFCRGEPLQRKGRRDRNGRLHPELRLLRVSSESRRTYLAVMQGAHALHRLGDHPAARRLIELAPVSHRNRWELRYIDTAVNPGYIAIDSPAASTLAATRDGRYLARRGLPWDPSCWLVDLESGLFRWVSNHPAPVGQLAMNADASSLAVEHQDGLLQSWRLGKGGACELLGSDQMLPMVWRGTPAISAHSLLPDGRLLRINPLNIVDGSPAGLSMMSPDLVQCKPFATDEGNFEWVGCTPCGTHAVALDVNGKDIKSFALPVHLGDALPRRARAMRDSLSLAPAFHTNWDKLEFDPSGRYLVARASGNAHGIVLLRPDTLETVAVYSFADQIAFQSTSDQLAYSDSGGGVHVAAAAREVKSREVWRSGEEQPILDLAWIGHLEVAVLVRDAVVIINVLTSKVVRRISCMGEAAVRVYRSPAEQHIVLGLDNGLRARRGDGAGDHCDVIHRSSRRCCSLSWSKCASYVGAVFDDGSARVWSVNANKCIWAAAPRAESSMSPRSADIADDELGHSVGNPANPVEPAVQAVELGSRTLVFVDDRTVCVSETGQRPCLVDLPTQAIVDRVPTTAADESIVAVDWRLRLHLTMHARVDLHYWTTQRTYSMRTSSPPRCTTLWRSGHRILALVGTETALEVWKIAPPEAPAAPTRLLRHRLKRGVDAIQIAANGWGAVANRSSELVVCNLRSRRIAVQKLSGSVEGKDEDAIKLVVSQRAGLIGVRYGGNWSVYEGRSGFEIVATRADVVAFPADERSVLADWQLLDAVNGETVIVLSEENAPAEAAFSPDGSLLAVADSEGAIKLWHAVRARHRHLLRRLGGKKNHSVAEVDGAAQTVIAAARHRLWGSLGLDPSPDALMRECLLDPIATPRVVDAVRRRIEKQA